MGTDGAGDRRPDVTDPRRPSPPVIFLMGATATGKTDLAVALVRRLPLEIVSVDSAMVYRGMDVGTAKPGPEVRAVAPHRLIDIEDPARAYSAARFRADARREIADIHAQGRIPLLVGGTMLYFRALAEGLAEMPPADPAVRARIEAQAAQQGWAALHARLARVDPASARRIHPNDPQRLQRALEVWELTGRPLSQIIAEAHGDPLPYRLVKLAVDPQGRAELGERIAARFHAMLAAGLVAEVEALRDRGDLHPELPARRAVGYRQVWAYLDGVYDYATMVARGITATHQLAKRQMTWLRAEPDPIWVPGGDPDRVGRRLEEILSNDSG